MSRVYLSLVVLMAVALGGCKNDSETAMSNMIDKVKEMTKVFKDIKDKDSAKAAKSKLEALNKEMNDVMTQTMNKKFNEEEMKKASEKYKADGELAFKELGEEMGRVFKIPGAPEALGGAVGMPMGGFGFPGKIK